MIRTQIYIPLHLHQSAKVVAQSRNESLAQLLRTFIEQGLHEEKKKTGTKPLSSLAQLALTGGPKNLSQKMDTYLYDR